MMAVTRVLPAMLLSSLVLPLAAQKAVTFNDEYHGDGHSFLLHLRGESPSQSGDWKDGSRLRAYSETHEGDYIVFVANSALYRLDQPTSVHEVAQMYAPMQELNHQQHALSDQQKPLSAQQRALSAEMRAAATPAEMSRIGAEQGDIGRAQGEIGRQQGVIGKQQGEIGRRIYEKVQGMIATCLKDNSCPVVEATKL